MRLRRKCAAHSAEVFVRRLASTTTVSFPARSYAAKSYRTTRIVARHGPGDVSRYSLADRRERLTVQLWNPSAKGAVLEAPDGAVWDADGGLLSMRRCVRGDQEVPTELCESLWVEDDLWLRQLPRRRRRVDAARMSAANAPSQTRGVSVRPTRPAEQAMTDTVPSRLPLSVHGAFRVASEGHVDPAKSITPVFAAAFNVVVPETRPLPDILSCR
jgi:hypothetical protein